MMVLHSCLLDRREICQSVTVVDSSACMLSSACFVMHTDSFGSSTFLSHNVENACGGLRSVLSPSFHSHDESRSQAQKSYIQESTSTALARDIASADKVLTATFWIFRDAHKTGFTFPSWFSAISLWHAMIRRP